MKKKNQGPRFNGKKKKKKIIKASSCDEMGKGPRDFHMSWARLKIKDFSQLLNVSLCRVQGPAIL